MSRKYEEGFLPAVIVAAFAGLGFLPAMDLTSHWLAPTTAAGLYLTLSAAAFTMVPRIPGGRQRTTALLVLVGGLLATAFSSTLSTTSFVLTGLLACCRAGVLHRKARLRHPWLAELGLGVAALAAAQGTVEPNLQGIALAIWSYWLVQSAYFLLPRTDQPTSEPDPFDEAVERATELIDTHS